MLTISGDLLKQMRAYLEAGYPCEACGILIGKDATDGGRVVHDLVRVPNAWQVTSERETLHNRFLIAPDDYVRADREAGERGLDVIGFFHSHPDCPSRPSETDRAFAMPYTAFVIVRVDNGHATTTNSWVLRDDRSAFDEEEVKLE
jgi:proteasome lid subunit RPN8/RPN11